MFVIYAISGGEIFQQALNGIAMLVGTSGFASLVKTMLGVSIALACVGYIRTRDVTSLFKWYFATTIVVSGLLVPKAPVQIKDISQPGAVFQVDNVPWGLAFIASFITSSGMGLAQSFELALSLPDDFSYHKTGMLFGAKMFEASHDFRILNPELKEEMNDYIKNCVIGDIRLNNKYTMMDLQKSSDVWHDVITKQPSPLRGLYINGQFYTCLKATPILESALKNEIESQSFHLFGRKIFGPNYSSTNYKNLFEQHLSGSYQELVKNSGNATDIFMQNMVMNALREGINAYSAQTGASGSLLNYINTKAQSQYILSMIALGKNAAWLLPIFYTILLMIMFCVFPITLLLSLMPGGMKHWVSYISALIWLQLWPIVYAIINLAMTFMLKKATGSLADDGINLINFDALNLTQSFFIAACGYLSMSVPFIAKGVLSRMGDVFSSLSTSFMSSTQGAYAQAAGEASTGNFSLGNTSMGNINTNNWHANKHDTNATHMHGLESTQLKSGAVKTTTQDGHTVMNSANSMSHTGFHLNSAESIESSFSKRASQELQAGMSDQTRMQSSIDSAFSSLSQFASNEGIDKKEGSSASLSQSTHVDKAASQLLSLAHQVGQREHVSDAKAFNRLTQAALGVRAGFHSDKSFTGKIAKYITGFKGSGDVEGRSALSSNHNFSRDFSADLNLTKGEVEDFRKNMSVVEGAAATEHTDTGSHSNSNHMEQIAADLRSAEHYGESASAHLNKSEQLGNMASFAESHRAAIDVNNDQRFVEYVYQREGRGADALFGNPGSASSQALLKNYANQFIVQETKDLEQQYQQQSHSVNPSQFYDHQKASIDKSRIALSQEATQNKEEITRESLKAGATFNTYAANAIRTTANTDIAHTKNLMGSKEKRMQTEGGKLEQSVDKKNGRVAEHAGRSITGEGLAGFKKLKNLIYDDDK